MAQILGDLTPLTSIPSNVILLGGKPSTLDPTKKDFVAIAGGAVATTQQVTQQVADEAIARNLAITTAINALPPATGGTGVATLAVDQTLTAAGVIDATKTFVIFNSASAFTATLGLGTVARGPLLLKNIGAGPVAISAQIDGVASTLTVSGKTAMTLAWAVAPLSSWELVGDYDAGVLVGSLALATLASTTLFPAYDPDGTAKRTTGAALTTFFAGGAAPGTSAPLASPAFTGNPTAPTPPAADNTTSLATTAYVKAVVAAIPAVVIPPPYVAPPSRFNVGVTQPGITGNAQKLMIYPLDVVVTLPAGLAGSTARALTAAAASAAFVFAFLRAGVSTAIATFTFAAAGTTATIGGITIPVLQVGDILTLTGPATADFTLADLGISIIGTRP